MNKKFEGIDERKIKCANDHELSIQSGISFDMIDENNHVLRFHFLDQISTNGGNNILYQKTKSMYLNEANIDLLISELKSIKKQIQSDSIK